MRMTNISAILLACISTASVFGQSGAVVGAGYAFPGPLTVSPGQVITIFVSGVGSKLTQRVTASTTPLPRTLAGISVSFQQVSSEGSIPVPLLSVYPVQTCLQIPFSCSTLLGITLQVPFEFPIVNGQQGFPNSGQLVVSDGVSTSGAFSLKPVPDQIHIARFGDAIAIPSGREGPVVTHADGSLV